MINEVMIDRLDEVTEDFDTPFFNYLMYSYGLSLDECESIVENLKDDMKNNTVITDNVVSALENRFRDDAARREKDSKIEYMFGLLERDGDFFERYLARYDLLESDIELISQKLREGILEDNIPNFEIKRLLIYYFDNSIKQLTYLRDLEMIRGRAYDTLIIKKACRKYPILVEQDIVEIVVAIRGEILDAREFRDGIRHEFLRQCMIRSESKKADALNRLNGLVEGTGDSFRKFVQSKGISKGDGELIVSEIRRDIDDGKIQPEEINNIFLTSRFNEFVDDERE